MQVVVCVKHVPEELTMRFLDGRWTLSREGVPGQINPEDVMALGVALDLKKKLGCAVAVITMGPASAEEALREALAMGADRAILISDPFLAGSDTLVTSKVLASSLRRLVPKFRLILCGTRSSDGDTGQVPPQLAEELSVPHVRSALELEVEDSYALVKRRWQKSYQTLKVRLPAVVSVARSRKPTWHVHLGAIFAAFEGENLSRYGIKELGFKPDEVGIAGSATVVRGVRETQATRNGRTFTGPPDEAVRLLIEVLRTHGVI